MWDRTVVLPVVRSSLPELRRKWQNIPIQSRRNTSESPCVSPGAEIQKHFEKQKIEKMFRFILPHMSAGKTITVTTYRDGVPEGVAARALYQTLGFVPGKMTVEFGSEVQEFVMEVAKWQIS